MNQETKEMKELVEANGGCWHEFILAKCKKCGVLAEPTTGHNLNPSPADLNALFEIAEKLSYWVEADFDFSVGAVHHVTVHDQSCGGKTIGQAVCEGTPADALRKALLQSIKKG